MDEECNNTKLDEKETIIELVPCELFTKEHTKYNNYNENSGEKDKKIDIIDFFFMHNYQDELKNLRDNISTAIVKKSFEKMSRKLIFLYIKIRNSIIDNYHTCITESYNTYRNHLYSFFWEKGEGFPYYNDDFELIPKLDNVEENILIKLFMLDNFKIHFCNDEFAKETIVYLTF